MKKLIITSILFLVSISFAQSYYVDLSNPEDLVNPSDYYEYKIVKGDCLWFISDDFYGDPYKWIKIHEANPYIINQDWIYPNNWLVIPNIFADEDGNPILGVDGKTWAEEETTWSETTKTWAGEEKTDNESSTAYIETDAKDTEGGGQIDTESETEISEEITESSESEVNAAAAASTTTATTAMASETEMSETEKMDAKDGHEHKKCEDPCECLKTYCGKPGWKLGLHAGFPLASAPEDESLNVGVLLGTPLGVKAGPFYIGLGAGAFTYNFEDLYIGGGVLASLCINELLKLDMPLMLQVHGAGYYVFGEESGPGFGVIGSGSLPIGDSPFSLGAYVGVGQYSPGEKDFTWGNAGAVLYYNF